MLSKHSLVFVLLILAGFLSSGAKGQENQPVASPERPVYTRDGNTVYSDIGDGPVLLWTYTDSNPRQLLEIYTPIEGPSVILSIDTNYRNVLVREHIIYNPAFGFDYAGYSMMSTAPIQGPVLFGEDGSIAFIQVDEDSEGQLKAQVIARSAFDFFDPGSRSLMLTLSPLLPVEILDDETAAFPILLSYTTDPHDFNAGTATFQLASGEVFQGSASGIALVADSAPPAEIISITAPDGKVLSYEARLGSLVLPVDLEGVPFYKPFDDGTRHLYVTAYSDANVRYYWLTLVTLRPFKVLNLLAWGGTYGINNDPILEGDASITPDGTKVLWSAYSDELGASLWMIDLNSAPPPDYDPLWDGPWMPEPILIDSSLPFIADAGNFALPRFVEITDEGFTVEVIYSVDRIELRSYTLD